MNTNNDVMANAFRHWSDDIYTSRDINTFLTGASMPPQKRAAQESDWKHKPMPERHEEFFLEMSFSDEDIDKLQMGFIPQVMEDHWFIYYKDNAVYFCRSWTGICIFIVYLSMDTGKHRVLVNRDPEQYGSKNIEEDRSLIESLLLEITRHVDIADIDPMAGI